ncbi:MAG: UvrD-helicase domain-containing protein, partial [Nitrospirae bacterium]|nr:UvrD-helicase domain-containing protein [Nitrospirota bacterium]
MKKYELKRFQGVAGNLKIKYGDVLNEKQLDVVINVDGPQLVIAGAGSGKTRTLVYRVAYL